MKIYLLTALGIGIFGLSVGAFGQTSTIPLYYLNGNIGVGITNPASKLVVFDGAADVKVDILTSGPGNDAILNLMGNSGGGSDAAIQFLDADGIFKKGLISYKLNTGEMTFSTSANERIRITASGNVGIGTPAPTELLHVNGNIRTMVGGVVYTDTVSGMNCTFNIKTAGTGDPILFSQGYAERMRIWNGRVGIGTTTPAKTLDVAGAAQFSASTEAALLLLAQTDTTASQLNLQPFNGSNGSIIYTTWRTGSGVLQFAAGNQYPTMTLTDTGRPHRFTNIDRYLAAKAIVTPKYENHSYDFQRFKCHNPIRDMIDATR